MFAVSTAHFGLITSYAFVDFMDSSLTPATVVPIESGVRVWVPLVLQDLNVGSLRAWNQLGLLIQPTNVVPAERSYRRMESVDPLAGQEVGVHFPCHYVVEQSRYQFQLHSSPLSLTSSPQY